LGFVKRCLRQQNPTFFQCEKNKTANAKQAFVLQKSHVHTGLSRKKTVTAPMIGTSGTSGFINARILPLTCRPTTTHGKVRWCLTALSAQALSCHNSKKYTVHGRGQTIKQCNKTNNTEVLFHLVSVEIISLTQIGVLIKVFLANHLACTVHSKIVKSIKKN